MIYDPRLLVSVLCEKKKKKREGGREREREREKAIITLQVYIRMAL